MATHQARIHLRETDDAGNGYPYRYSGTTIRDLIPAFLKDVDGSWFGDCVIPQNYVSTPKILLGLTANATSGITRMIVSSKSVADTGSVNVTYTAETAQDLTVPATARNLKVATFTLTVAGLAAGELLKVRVQHDGAHANDTLAVDTELHYAVFQYADA